MRRLFLLFVVVPLFDLALLIWTAGRIGIWWTVLLVVGTAALGAALVKRQGVAVWLDVRRRFSEGTVPTRQLAHGALIVAAGALLVAPGIITDLTGLLLLVPAVREWARVRVVNRYTRRTGRTPVRVQVWR